MDQETASAELIREYERPIARKMFYEFVLVIIVLGAGLLLAWLFSVDWVLKQFAFVMLAGNAFVGIYVGRQTYKLSSSTLYSGTRLAISIIMGLSAAVIFAEITRSHKLIRYYDLYGSDE